MRRLQHLELFVATPASCQNAQNLDRNSHSNFLRAFEVCLELSSDLKDQLSFVADEFCELVRTNKNAMFATLFVTRSATTARPARPSSQKHAEFRHNFSFKRRGSRVIRSLFRITKRFKRFIWFCSWGIFRA